MTRYQDIIENLKNCDKPAEAIDKEVCALLDIGWSPDEDGQFGGYGIMPDRVRFTSSIDATVSLIEKALPGWRWTVHSPRLGKKFGCGLADPRQGGHHTSAESEVNAPYAMLIAIFQALEEA